MQGRPFAGNKEAPGFKDSLSLKWELFSAIIYEWSTWERNCYLKFERNRRYLRRLRRLTVKKWEKMGSPGDEPGGKGPGRRRGCGRPFNPLLRFLLLLGAALELMWMFLGSGGIGLSMKDAVKIRFIEERRISGPSRPVGNPLERTGVKVRLEDGSISIFRVNEYPQTESD